MRYDKHLTVRVPRKLYEQLREACKETTLSDCVREALESYVARKLSREKERRRPTLLELVRSLRGP